MRVLVCGDREWTDYHLISGALACVEPDVVIHGGCRGADAIAGDVAQSRGIPVLCFPAEWKRYGGAAGPIRNRKMLEEGKPDVVFAFHDDLSKSKGTKDMVEKARKAGIKVQVFNTGNGGDSR